MQLRAYRLLGGEDSYVINSCVPNNLNQWKHSLSNLKALFGIRFFHRKSEGNQNGGKEDGHSVWNKGKERILSSGIL